MVYAAAVQRLKVQRLSKHSYRLQQNNYSGQLPKPLLQLTTPGNVPAAKRKQWKH
jgi:hypothetical protein